MQEQYYQKQIRKKYYFQIQQAQQYPFLNEIQDYDYFNYKVKIKVQVKPPFTAKYYYNRIKKINKIGNQNKSLFVNLQEICQNKSICQFILTYQYLSYNISSGINEINGHKICKKNISAQALLICQQLVSKGIIPELNENLFGFDNKGKLKYLLLPNFQILNLQKIHINSFFSQFVKQVNKFIKKVTLKTVNYSLIEEYDKFSQRKSQTKYNEYNKKFQQKISFYQNKLLNNKNKVINQRLIYQKFKKQKKYSQNFAQSNLSLSSYSSNSNNKNKQQKPPRQVSEHLQRIRKVRTFFSTKSQEIVKGYNKKRSLQKIEWLNEIQNLILRNNDKKSDFRSSGSSNKYIQNPQKKVNNTAQKLSNSLIIEEKNQQSEKLKHHKSSFGDYSNYNQQNQKSSKLKTRVSSALEKSQCAVALFERLQIIHVKKV